LIPHENMSGLERLPLLQKLRQLDVQLQPLLLQAFEFGNLLLERGAQSSLLAGRLIERRQPRQLAGLARVDLGDALTGLSYRGLAFANLTRDGRNVFFYLP
jgi:hypothetical protein